MDEHVIAFIGALRAAGVRISLGESLDALHALPEAGVAERTTLRHTLRTTLIKEQSDRATFERLFEAYFAGAGAGLIRTDQGRLGQDELEQLHTALQATLQPIDSPTLRLLFEAMVTGQTLRRTALDALLERTTRIESGSPILRSWMARRTLRELEFERLDSLRDQLLAALGGLGIDEQVLASLGRDIWANQTTLAEQIAGSVASQMARYERPGRPALPPEELLDLPLRLLSQREDEELREAVERMARQLRTRAALRRRRARRGPPDPRATLRASLRYGGVPFALRHRRRHLKARLVVLCDLSRSMRALSGMTLSLIYALHAQLGGTRSFAYIDDLHDISAEFSDARPAQAVATVLDRIRAEYTRTDLGSCLDIFTRQHLALVDRRTTVLILGDGRNNRSDPGLDSLRRIRARARHLIWLTPDPQRDWGSGDSDMLTYAPLCSVIHVVENLRQLSSAIADLL